MKIIRVFPRKTSYTPNDEMVFIGEPPMFRPTADEVHISCVFTWDIGESNHLFLSWKRYYDNVKVGGPAFRTPVDGFTPGLYTKKGITFTSRGCNNNCEWCLVPYREGKLKEIEIQPGNIIQDNNLLQCNKEHIEKVFDMLGSQRKIQFTGGLDARLITSDIADKLRSIRLLQLFTACDCKEMIPVIKKVGSILKDLPLNKKRCYVMIGYNGENISDATERLETVYSAGFIPFTQLYKPINPVSYDKNWMDLQRNWSRPAITKIMQHMV